MSTQRLHASLQKNARLYFLASIDNRVRLALSEKEQLNHYTDDLLITHYKNTSLTCVRLLKHLRRKQEEVVK